MEDIIRKANELGLMIKQTEACRDFEMLSARIDRDEDASTLLKKYNEIAETIQKKHESGGIVEKYEQEMFRALTETVKENSLIVDYLRAREIYIELLLKIHDSINSSV